MPVNMRVEALKQPCITTILERYTNDLGPHGADAHAGDERNDKPSTPRVLNKQPSLMKQRLGTTSDTRRRPTRYREPAFRLAECAFAVEIVPCQASGEPAVRRILRNTEQSQSQYTSPHWEKLSPPLPGCRVFQWTRCSIQCPGTLGQTSAQQIAQNELAPAYNFGSR